MTLEKLLIFGFALAALFAITTIGINMMNNRGEQIGEFDKSLESLAESGS